MQSSNKLKHQNRGKTPFLGLGKNRSRIGVFPLESSQELAHLCFVNLLELIIWVSKRSLYTYRDAMKELTIVLE